MNRRTWAFAAAGLALTSFGCPSSSPKPCTSPISSVVKTGETVAKVGGGTITTDEVKARFAEQPAILLERYRTNPAQKLEFVNNMVKFEILSQEAIAKGLDKTPEAQQQFKRMLVQELIKSYYDQKVEVSDEELKKYYEKHVDDYVKPEKTRVQQIFLAAPEGTDAKTKAARADAKGKAARMLAQIKAEEVKLRASKTPLPPNAPMTVLTDLAKNNSSDAATKPLGGDTRFQSMDELTKTYSAEFAKAAFALTGENNVSAVIETPKGFHVARLLGKQGAQNQSFDDAKFKEELKTRFLAENRSQRFEEYYQGLKKAANVSVDEKVLATVEVPEKSKAGGAPGFPGGQPRAMPMPPGGIPHAAPGAMSVKGPQ